MTVHGSRPDVFSVENGKCFEAQFFLYPPTGTIYENPSLSVIRKRKVGDGFHEDVTVFNLGNERKQMEIRLEAAADFADLFEVRDALAKKGDLYREVRDDVLVLGYRRDDFVRETLVTSGEPAQITDDGFAFNLKLEPQSGWNTCIDVRPVTEETVEAVKYGHEADDAHPNMALTLEQWIDEAPSLSSDADDVQHVYRKSLVDLAALRFYSLLFPGESLPAAGLPWFMTNFGRDSLITSYESLPFTPDLARTALRVLAARQGTNVDDFRDEEPGQDPARDPLRRARSLRRAASLPLLRLRGHDAVLPHPARRVRALDGRHGARSLAGAERAGGARVDRTVRRRLRRVPAP